MANKPHPHIDVITAWYNGSPCQIRYTNSDVWDDLPMYDSGRCHAIPGFYPDNAYRVKPKTTQYRIAKTRTSRTNETYPMVVEEDGWDAFQRSPLFICWLQPPFEC